MSRREAKRHLSRSRRSFSGRGDRRRQMPLCPWRPLGWPYALWAHSHCCPETLDPELLPHHSPLPARPELTSPTLQAPTNDMTYPLSAASWSPDSSETLIRYTQRLSLRIEQDEAYLINLVSLFSIQTDVQVSRLDLQQHFAYQMEQQGKFCLLEVWGIEFQAGQSTEEDCRTSMYDQGCFLELTFLGSVCMPDILTLPATLSGKP